MANSYQKGNIVVCSGTYRNSSNSLADPGVPLFAFRDALGRWTRGLTPTRLSLGLYTYNVDTTSPASGQQQETWYYEFYTPVADILQTAGQQSFTVVNPGVY